MIRGLTIDQEKEVSELTSVRFKNKDDFTFPEALVLYEQGFMNKETLFSLCEEEYGFRLEVPVVKHIPQDIVEFYDGQNCVPLEYDSVRNIVHLLVPVDNCKDNYESYNRCKITRHLTPIYHYVSAFERVYGHEPEYLCDLTPKDLLKLILTEGIDIGASDIHIAPKKDTAEVFFKVRKRKVYSNRTVKLEQIEGIINLIAIESDSKYEPLDVDPKYMALPINIHHRGRVVINRTIWGNKATIRILSNDIFSRNLEDLKIDIKTVKFLRKYFESLEPGLYLIVGPTSSGKNTTIASIIHELNKDNKYVTVSVENPVEIYMDNVEQIQANSAGEFASNIESLIRSDPDIVYTSEFTGRSGKSIMEVVNTAKPVFCTIHANDIASVVTRIQDLTGLSYARIIEQLSAVVFQDLKRDDEKDILYPVTHFMRFTREFKEKALVMEYGELITALHKEEDRWRAMDENSKELN